jgi:cysteine desulfuration protein SufE
MSDPVATSPAIQDPRLAELVEEFGYLDDWEARYSHVIGLGRALAPLAPDEKVEAAKVRGCASQVWLLSERTDGGLIRFRGESDAAIVQGLLAVLLRLYSDRPAGEIAALDAGVAMAALGLADALTPQRSNGVKSMATRIREVAREAL